MTHWAYSYIGMPYSDEHDCWWVVRDVYRMHFSVDLPIVADAPGEETIRHVARGAGVRPASAPPQELDIVLMRSPLRLHAGIVTLNARRIGVLHSTRETGVVWQSWREATAGVTVELWRRHV